MKKLLFLNLLLITAFSFSSFDTKKANTKAEALEAYFGPAASCELKGKKLFGKVQFVSSQADFKIQYVDSYADINVQMVSSGATSCGKWQEVSSGADLKIQIVNSFPDLKVKLVKSSPGMN